jgi:hypothetical protein
MLIGIVLAIITALTAVLLPHRGHHAPPQWPAIGELHPLAERQGLIVPRGAVVL